MEAQKIREMLPEIPVSEGEPPYKSQDMWIEVDGGALLTVSHHLLRLADGTYDCLLLSICGENSERSRVFRDFWDYLGDPSKANINNDAEHTDEITWLIRSSLFSEVLQRRGQHPQ